ncbi:MAG TPA: hypothetical protein VMG08_12290 [Allosphingosinicella sp.]|nr:hypothetical protein [Allosphingosinicella sp.]
MLTRRHLLVPAIFGILVAAAGCATDPLRIEYAQSASAKGKAAATASRTFLDRVEAGRQALSIDLVAADPACARPDQRAMVRIQALTDRNAPARGWLCVPRGWNGSGQDIDISRAPLANDPEMRATLGLIDALSTYSDALAEVVGRTGEDPAAALNDAFSTARAIQGFLLAATGTEKGPIWAADDPRAEAITGFVTFLGELAHQRAQVNALREVIENNPDVTSVTIATLRESIQSWESVRNSEDGLRIAASEVLLNGILNKQPPATAAARREAMRADYDRKAESDTARQVAPALYVLLDAFAQADADLRRILPENGPLNARERRRVAEIARQRIVRALERVTALITAFAGA